MNTDQFLIRKADMADASGIFELYKTVSKKVGGLARTEIEITSAYVANFTAKSIESGVQFVIIDQLDENKIIGEIHCYKLEPTVFRHVLSELTVAVDPSYQGKGLGKKLFITLLTEVQTLRTEISRVELIARESNLKAIELYEKLGFKIEGRFERRISNDGSSFEADIPMAWFPDFE